MKNLILALVALCAVKASANYLYYYVDQSSTSYPVYFEYARVGVAGLDNVFLNIKGETTTWLAGDGTGRSTGTAATWIDLGSYAAQEYCYYVALYGKDAQTIVGISDSVNYKELYNYIYQDGMSLSGADAWRVTSFHAAPEPTTGVLVLLGVGLLALRRKRRVLMALMGLVMVGGAFAAQNDTLVTFSSKGPDCYADGTVVKDGECYALVWVKGGTAFAGLTADGKLVDPSTSDLVLTVPLAKAGHCPTTAFELNAMRMEKYAGGSFEIYLLDTRTASGVVQGVNAQGQAAAVNGYGKVATGDTTASTTATASAQVSETTAVPAGTPQPVIKAMKVVGGNVYLTVSQTVPCLQYRISGGATPETAGNQALGEAANGKSGEDIILVAPVTGDSGYFKVRRQGAK